MKFYINTMKLANRYREKIDENKGERYEWQNY
jgi:hypothetical protein